jgi:hypothetical protein
MTLLPRAIGGAAGALVIALILLDAFETILQPRRVTHRWRFARLFYRTTWRAWRSVAVMFKPGKRREAMLGTFGPLSLLTLFAAWMGGLVLGFALLHWSLRSVLMAPEARTTFLTYLYMSGTTFFTLGLGDVTPLGGLARALAVLESGLGFGFLAVVITYLPVLYQAFSRREVTISLLDARAGSPPSAGQLLLRAARAGNMHPLDAQLAEWEQWAAELLESHLSFPVLSYYRSQHDNQSWLAALTTMLDTCAVLLAETAQANAYRAQLTFAIARHAAVDLALVLKTPPHAADMDRFPPARRGRLREALAASGIKLNEPPAAAGARLDELRGMYEPFLEALARRFLFALPMIFPEDEAAADNWQRSAWMRRTRGIGSLPVAGTDDDEHFS